MRKLILLIIVFLSGLEAQEEQLYSSQAGRYFIVGFLKNEIIQATNELNQRIFIGTVEDTKVTLIYPDQSSDEYFIPAFTSQTIIVDEKFEHKNFETPTKDKLIRIVATNPITVYGYSTRTQSSDMYTAYPVNSWGEQYIITSSGNDFYLQDGGTTFREANRTGEALIMAAYDNTQVDILLNANSRTKQKGDVITINLNNGDSYLLGGSQIPDADDNDVALRGSNDLTGTVINSNKPIGVISGHERSSMPQTSLLASDSKDHLNEMLVPTSSWGSSFVTIPFNFHGDNYYKVVSKEDDTFVEISSGTFNTSTIINKNEYYEVYLEEPAIWKADKPVQIMQFMARKPETECEVYFDPAMLLVNPIDSYVNNVFFQTPPETIDNGALNGRPSVRCNQAYLMERQYEIQQVSILMDEEALTDITLDGAPLTNVDLAASTTFELENKRFYYTNKVVSPGSHFVNSQNGKFTLLNYGIGLFDSYAHSTGISIYNENADLDVNPPQLEYANNCSSFEIESFDVLDYDLGVYDMKENPNNFNVLIEEDYNFLNNGINVFGVVDNKEEDAYFSSTFLDYQNNSTSFSFTYTGIKTELSAEPDLGIHTPNSIITTTFSITNQSDRVLTLEDLRYNSKINIPNLVDLDYDMQPGEELILYLEINTNGEFGKQLRQIIAVFECDIEKSVDIIYEIQNISVDITGYDFRDVYLGDSKEGVIRITNSGLKDIYLDRLVFSNNLVFDFDDEGLKNILLAENESHTFSATFSPEARINYNEPVTVFAFEDPDATGASTNAVGIVQGRGIAPQINSIEDDFGTVWVGDDKQRTYAFENTGNVAGTLKFTNFENLRSYSVNSENTLQAIDEIIEPGARFEFDIVFEPDQVGEFQIDALFETNWVLHPEISFRSIGNAIQEEITPIDNCTNSDTIFSENDYKKSYFLFENTGTEAIIISDIEIIQIERFFNGVIDLLNPNDPRFEISNKNDIIQNTLNPNDFVPIEMEYTNLDEGIYRIKYLFSYEDPNPESDEIIELENDICLNVKENPDFTIQMGLQGNLTASPCIAEPFEFEIENIGNTDLNITELEVASSADIFMDDFDLPITITENNSAFFNGSLLIDLEDNSSISFSGKMIPADIDTVITFFYEETVDVIPESIYGPQPNLSYSINEEGNVQFEFEFPYTVEEPIECEMSLTADPKLMYLTDNNVELIVGKGTINEEVINLTAEHTDNLISFTQQPFTLDISNDRKVNFELPFLFLLINYYETEIEFKVNSGRCFLPFDGIYNLELDGDCVYRYRPVESADDGLELSLDRSSNLMNLSFETPGETPVSVWITDIRGSKVAEFEKKFVNIGKHSLNYNLSALPNGNYFLTFQTNYLTRNRILIKSN